MALDFLILYEHTVREYESDLLLKLELERRGYTVRIRQLLDAKDLRLFGKDKPEVLVASCMYDNEAINSHVYNNIGQCNKIVNLHWEQMLSDTQEEGDWFNMNGNAKRCVQTCWGQRTAQRLQAHGMDAKNTPVTGAVMMDFLRPEFKGYFKDKETLCKEFGLDPAKQLHLYISSFGYASMTDQEVAELSKMAGTDFSGFARTNRVSMEKTLAWFDRYLGDHPEVELVYRRHPSEWKCKALDELAAKRPNFHVIFADSVKQCSNGVISADFTIESPNFYSAKDFINNFASIPTYKTGYVSSITKNDSEGGTTYTYTGTISLVMDGNTTSRSDNSAGATQANRDLLAKLRASLDKAASGQSDASANQSTDTSSDASGSSN